MADISEKSVRNHEVNIPQISETSNTYRNKTENLPEKISIQQDLHKKISEIQKSGLNYKPQLSHLSETAWVSVGDSKNGNSSNNRSRMAFLGSSSNFNLLFEPQEEGGSFHYKLPDAYKNIQNFNEIENEEIEILKFRGAFTLPPKDLRDEIVEAYFEKIHPTFPMLNRSQFMRRYNDPNKPASLLLLQAILLAGSRVCNSSALLDDKGSVDTASYTFYKRAKALYDANYEPDPITVVQSVVLLGWWWEGPGDMTKNSFYWLRVALGISQGFGLHRSVENSDMNLATKRTWKKMWWTLFLRDRWSAIALGRPVLINLEDSDVSMLTEDDFIEDEPGLPALFPVNKVQILAFIHSVKLSEIMGIVLRQQFSINAEISRRQNKIPAVSQCDMTMGSWMNNLPPELKFSVKDKNNHNFFLALLHAQYYTVLCLVHRSNILRKGQTSDRPYPFWGIAFQAAHMISRIFEILLAHDQVADCSVFYVYTLFSAAIMLLYQTESHTPSAVESAKKALKICISALKEIGKKWVVARMIINLFDELDSNTSLRNQFVQDARKRAYASSTDSKSKKPKIRKFTKSSISTKNEAFESKNARSTASSPLCAPKDLQNTNNTKFTANETPQILPLEKSVNLLHTTSFEPTRLDVNIASDTATLRQKNANEWKNDHLSSSSVKNSKESTFSININDIPLNAHNPDFLLVANNLSDSKSFYQNFQPSQLFPDPNESENPTGVPDMLTISPSAIFGDNVNSSNSSTRGQTPSNEHTNCSNSSTGFDQSQTLPIPSIVSDPSLVEHDSIISHTQNKNDYSEMIPDTLNITDWYQYFSLANQNINISQNGASTNAGLSNGSSGDLSGILSLHSVLGTHESDDIGTEIKHSDAANLDFDTHKRFGHR